MEPEILAGVEAEISEFQSRENRPDWPNAPTPCPVASCGDVPYQSYTSFVRHWQAKHQPSITLYRCPNCNKTFNRRDNARKHQVKAHKMTSDVETFSASNSNFIDPLDKLPYRINHRERLATKRRHTEITGEVLMTEGADCRDEDITFDEDGQTTGKIFKRK